MAEQRIPDPTLMARLQLSAKGVDWVAGLVAHREHEQIGGEWSPHQQIFHLLSNERVFQERIRLAMSHERPVFARWDSEGDLRDHHDASIPIASLADQFMAAREETAGLFKSLAPEDWRRTGVWPDGRVIDLAWLAEKVLWHALDHFAALLDLHGEMEPLQSRRWFGN